MENPDKIYGLWMCIVIFPHVPHKKKVEEIHHFADTPISHHIIGLHIPLYPMISPFINESYTNCGY